MKVSLIMPTINRYDDVELFFESLAEQTYKNFELIIVDQNKDDNILNLAGKYTDKFEMKYIKSREKGLSLSRNKGLREASGELTAFPDDDCEYSPDTLEKVVDFFKNNPEYKIYSCRTLEKGKDYGTGIMLTEKCEINYDNSEFTVKSITFFVNFSTDEKTLFDEKLGVGAYFGSGEETDYILDLLHKGYKGLYFPDDIIYHPAKKGNFEDSKRAYSYALGYGALVKKEVKLRKNKKYIKKYIKKLFRSFGGMIISKEKKYYYNVLTGRLAGYFKYKI